MFNNHPTFSPPADPNTKIWRYMDFSKLTDLLISSDLYFNRVDKFEDLFEGYLNTHTLELLRQGFVANNYPNPDEMVESIRNLNLIDRRLTYVNCWHINPFESDAMWKTYIKANEGIAIQSTYQKLVASFDPNDSRILYVGSIKYCDFSNTQMPPGNMLWPFVHKRMSFAHENELRVLHKESIPSGMGTDMFNYDNNISSTSFKTDLNVLIDTIYISPYAQRWLHQLVHKLCVSLNFTFAIKMSEINDLSLI